MTQDYAMFTDEGNELVGKIVDAAVSLNRTFGDSPQSVFRFAMARLEVLSYGEGMGEAMDTSVREAVYTALSQEIPGFHESMVDTAAV